jgi:hypothetical protein
MDWTVGIARCGYAWREKSQKCDSTKLHAFPLTIYCFQTLLNLALVWGCSEGIEFRGIELAKRANDRDVVPGRRSKATSWRPQKFTCTPRSPFVMMKQTLLHFFGHDQQTYGTSPIGFL